MTPFLKWAGGKRWLVANYSHLLYRGAERYIEPFLGSGAVFFHLKPNRAILSDLNSDLVGTYQSLRDEPLKVLQHLKVHQRNHGESYYYQIRGQRPRKDTTRAARFLYLNRTCFNGIYRVNLDGEFNVPKGSKDKVLLPTDDFNSLSSILKRVELDVCDFGDTIAKAGPGDFLYVDPPYTVKHNSNNFVRYNERIFTWFDQKRLADMLEFAVKRGARVCISNADHSSIHELYSSACWSRMTVSRYSGLASSAAHRNKGATEAIITNYLDPEGNHTEPRF